MENQPQKQPQKKNYISRKIDESFDRLHQGLENLAEMSVSKLDENLYHLTLDDLNKDKPLLWNGDFERLKVLRKPYLFQGVLAGIETAGFFTGGLMCLVGAVSSAGKALGYDAGGEELLANQEYVGAWIGLGSSALLFETSRFFFDFGKSTIRRYETLMGKTDAYAKEHGLKTATVE